MLSEFCSNQSTEFSLLRIGKRLPRNEFCSVRICKKIGQSIRRVGSIAVRKKNLFWGDYDFKPSRELTGAKLRSDLFSSTLIDLWLCHFN